MFEEFKPLAKNKRFTYLWASQIFSQLTIHIMNFLLLIRIFSATNSAIATSFLWVAYALPAILIGPFAAAAVDILDRRKLLMTTNFSQSAVIFFYALSHETSLFLLYGIAMAYSFLNQFYVPAELASLPSLVGKKTLAYANSLFFLTQQSALVVGFGVAGLMNQILGFTKTLYICSSFLFIAFLSVSFLPKMKAGDSFPKKFEEAFIKFFKRILEGYRFIKEKRNILAPFVLLMTLQISIAVVVVNVPVLAKEILKVAIESAGLVVVVPAGVGAASGALFVPRLIKRGWRKKRIIDTSLMVLTLALFVLVFVVPEFFSWARIFLGAVAILVAGASFVGILIPSQTYLQEATPGGLRGRVFGNYWFFVTVATVFPVIFSGALTELFGVRLLYFLLTALAFSALLVSKKFGQKIIENAYT